MSEPQKRGKTAQQEYEGRRDLRYHPLGVNQPMNLTRDQIESFNRNGYLTGFTAFEGTAVESNRRYFDGLLQMAYAAGLKIDDINGWQQTSEGVYDLCVHSTILGPISDLLGPNVICLGAHYFCKLPRDPKQVMWHQDASYWPMSPSKTISAWLAVDDVNRGNAALRVIPGTHLIGELTTELSEKDEANVLSEKVPGAEELGEPVYLELKAGQMSIHSGLLLHGSTANESDRRRCGVAIRYCTPDVRGVVSSFALNKESLWARGEDRDAYWANLPRPEGDSIPEWVLRTVERA